MGHPATRLGARRCQSTAAPAPARAEPHPGQQRPDRAARHRPDPGHRRRAGLGVARRAVQRCDPVPGHAGRSGDRGERRGHDPAGPGRRRVPRGRAALRAALSDGSGPRRDRGRRPGTGTDRRAGPGRAVPGLPDARRVAAGPPLGDPGGPADRPRPPGHPLGPGRVQFADAPAGDQRNRPGRGCVGDPPARRRVVVPVQRRPARLGDHRTQARVATRRSDGAVGRHRVLDHLHRPRVRDRGRPATPRPRGRSGQHDAPPATGDRDQQHRPAASRRTPGAGLRADARSADHRPR